MSELKEIQKAFEELKKRIGGIPPGDQECIDQLSEQIWAGETIEGAIKRSLEFIYYVGFNRGRQKPDTSEERWQAIWKICCDYEGRISKLEEEVEARKGPKCDTPECNGVHMIRVRGTCYDDSDQRPWRCPICARVKITEIFNF